jgi:hypothetical protein
MPHSNFDGFVKGKGAHYTNFWAARLSDLEEYTESQKGALYGYLDEKVFGVDMDDDEEEFERQKAFNEVKQGELKARAAREKGNGDKNGGPGNR